MVLHWTPIPEIWVQFLVGTLPSWAEVKELPELKNTKGTIMSFKSTPMSRFSLAARLVPGEGISPFCVNCIVLYNGLYNIPMVYCEYY